MNNPEDESAGTRIFPFSRELFIEQDDFREVPPPKYYRLSPGTEVRLRYAYIIKCEKVIKDAQGNITEIHCTYDPETKSGLPTANRKVKATIHWVSARNAVDAEVRLYDRLFIKENPDECGRRKGFSFQSQSEFFASAHTLQSGTDAWRCGAGKTAFSLNEPDISVPM